MVLEVGGGVEEVVVGVVVDEVMMPKFSKDSMSKLAHKVMEKFL